MKKRRKKLSKDHRHAFVENIVLARKGLRLQCRCGRRVIYTTYMEIEWPYVKKELPQGEMVDA
jgi:hypothetical protein